jgi:hypothetical protein
MVSRRRCFGAIGRLSSIYISDEADKAALAI